MFRCESGAFCPIVILMSTTNDDHRVSVEGHVAAVHRLLFMGVFTAPVLQPFMEPVFVSLILKLNDLLQTLSTLGHRITFADDVPSGMDITDLVNKVRNAIAHPSSPENLLDKESHFKFVFNVIHGKGTLIALPSATADHADDLAFFFGEHRLYLNRHLFRLFNEALAAYRLMYPDHADRFVMRLRFASGV